MQTDFTYIYIPSLYYYLTQYFTEANIAHWAFKFKAVYEFLN